MLLIHFIIIRKLLRLVWYRPISIPKISEETIKPNILTQKKAGKYSLLQKALRRTNKSLALEGNDKNPKIS